MYYVYLLLCADDTIYTGITTDVKRRLEEHKSGKGGNYTRAKKALRIIYQEVHKDRSSASKREAAIKKLPRSAKLLLGTGSRRSHVKIKK